MLNNRGEDPDGEDSAWIRVQVGSIVFDACTRQCAITVLEREDVVAMHDAYVESIMEVARLIREGHEEEDDDGDDDDAS